MDPKLQSHKTLSNQIALLNALKELETNDEETTKYLSSKYKNLLASQKEAKAEFESMPSHLDRLYGNNNVKKYNILWFFFYLRNLNGSLCGLLQAQSN